MNLKTVEQKVLEQFEKHNLKDWKFEWIQRRRKFHTAGWCDWKNKVIKIQPTFVELNLDEEIINTILHEIAHALKPKHGHNKFWKKKFIELGGNGKRCFGKSIIREKI